MEDLTPKASSAHAQTIGVEASSAIGHSTMRAPPLDADSMVRPGRITGGKHAVRDVQTALALPSQTYRVWALVAYAAGLTGARL
ncbi:hypothetical protein GCM10027562_26260 [Arthrobacter pigmenti]